MVYSEIFAALIFCKFHKKIPVRENIIMNMLFPYILTVMTYLVRKKLNAKIAFHENLVSRNFGLYGIQVFNSGHHLDNY